MNPDEHTLYEVPAQRAAEPCQRCGRIFETGFKGPDGKLVKGHIPGDKTCVAAGGYANRDARDRKAARAKL